jgi:hypothetical protein
MPFDGLPEGVVSDLVKLRLARDGLAKNWEQGALGHQADDTHCAIGWLLVATDWDPAETARLAHDYLYPALPKCRRLTDARPVNAVIDFNDDSQRVGTVLRMFDRAIVLAGG